MTPEAVAIIERLFKAFVFVPMIALIGWWIFSSWLDKTLDLQEAAIGFFLLGIAFFLGVTSIVRGGWGFLGIVAFIYLALVGLLVWEFVYWRRRENEHRISEVARYREAVERDPKNAAAYSFLAENLLALSRFEEAEEVLQTALELDPQSKRDRRLLRQAKERRPRVKWQRTD